MEKTATFLVLLGLVSCASELDKAQQPELSSCAQSQPPPCIQLQPTQSTVCPGDNASVTYVIELPMNVILSLTTLDIAIYRDDELFIQGFTQPSSLLPGHERWHASHTMSEPTVRSGLLTVKVDVYDLQPEDEFISRVEIKKQLKTPSQSWFKVNNSNCSNSSSQTETNDLRKLTNSDDLIQQVLHRIGGLENGINYLQQQRSNLTLCNSTKPDEMKYHQQAFNFIIFMLLAVVVLLLTGGWWIINKLAKLRAIVKSINNNVNNQNVLLI